ncbi:uncharacterized protein LOC126842958 [Adelges cooleyi]|uniref:uncharacterized protein LOC126842958 n=1 Tax=Adelges cooleyi TaxID=133065 RepID=UPI0021809095|nr:uncharacterized protein LOC126842958 [Adelges cooleyi]
MKVNYVLLFYTILNVLANNDGPFYRMELETTNVLIGIHIKAKTMWNMINFVVGQDNISMKQLTFMFALPEQDYDPDSTTQIESEIKLQRWLREASGLEAGQIAADVRCQTSVNDLGEARRLMLKSDLRDLLIHILKNPSTHNMHFEHTCRLIGLFLSMKITAPSAYTTSADVSLPPDYTCVIRHESDILQSFKLFPRFIRFVNNENHRTVGGSILAFIQHY